MCPSPGQDRTADTTLQPDVRRSPAPRTTHAKVQTIPGGECNCLLHALRHAPGQKPNRAEAPNLRAKIGEHVMENPGTTTEGSSGESFRGDIARVPALTGYPTPENYNKHMFQMQPRGYCGTLEVRAFVQRIEPGTSVAIYTRLPDDKTTYRNGNQGNFALREQHCRPGPVQHAIQILHTPGHYDYLEPISE